MNSYLRIGFVAFLPLVLATHTALGAVLYTVTDLGTLGGTMSEAYGINNSGQVVGWSDASNGDNHAFLCSGSGRMQDLNDLIDPASRWTLTSAHAINDLGQIVGHGTNPQLYTHAFRLDPIPEPTTLALLGISAVALLVCGWRRRWRAKSVGYASA